MEELYKRDFSTERMEFMLAGNPYMVVRSEIAYQPYGLSGSSPFDDSIKISLTMYPIPAVPKIVKPRRTYAGVLGLRRPK